MDIQSYVQMFEAHIQGYTGDDPLDLWDRYVLWAEETFPPHEKRKILHLLERLVQNFAGDTRYCNDERYLKYCIRFAETVNEPLQFFEYLYSRGIGTVSAVLHVIWAQQLEAKGDLRSASSLYQKAFQNQAQPKDLVERNYRSFQMRISQKTDREHNVQPLRESQSLNRIATASDTDVSLTKYQSSAEIPNPVVKADAPLRKDESNVNKWVTISKSAVLPQSVASSTEIKQIPMYCKDKLICGDSELSLEEFRANLYRKKYEQKLKIDYWDEERRKHVRTKEFELQEQTLRQKMEQLSKLLSVQEAKNTSSSEASEILSVPSHYEQSSVAQPSSSPGITQMQLNPTSPGHPMTVPEVPGLDINTSSEPVIVEKEQQLPVPFDDSMFTKPSSALEAAAVSFSDVQKTMVQSTSIHTGKLQPGVREAVGNTSGCLSNTSHVTPNTSLGYVQATPSKVLPSPTVNTKEALGFIMDIFQTSNLRDDEEDDHLSETVDPNKLDLEALCRNDDNLNSNAGGFLGVYNAAPALPSSFCIYEDDTAKIKRPALVKPVEVKTFGERPAFRPTLGSEEVKAAESLVDDSTVWAVRCNKTLAPSPNSTGDFALSARLASTPASSRLPEQTWQILGDKENTMAADTDSSCNVGWDYSSDKTLQPAKIRKLSPIQEQSPDQTKLAAVVPSPSSCSIFPAKSSDITMEADDVGKRLAACKLSETLGTGVINIEDPWGVTTQPFSLEEEKESEIHSLGQVVVENPWDDNLIARFLSELPTPLGSLASYHRYPTNLPHFKLKTVATLGSLSFSIDHLLGEGAFAHVYQASKLNVNTQHNSKVTLKVQKPAKPWEFYIGAQISQRISPELKHLFISFSEAHVFQNGSVLVGDLFGHGSLLNAINLYKKISEKVMPVPLVMYFAINILYIVEQLHNIGIIHGDIKPDNFALGENFMDNKSCKLDLVSHGLALIDLGQSIDMTLFPKGTVFMGKCETSGFQCVEMLTKRPWSHQTDYFGVAGTVYCMLFGNYMKVHEENGVWKTDGSFKRFPNGELWLEFFHTLLNVPSCHSPSPLPALREKLTAVFQMYTNGIKSLRNRLVILLLENKPYKK